MSDVLNRPANWPFTPDQRWGQDQSNLEPWDRVTWTLTEDEVYRAWLTFRQSYGSGWVGIWAISPRDWPAGKCLVLRRLFCDHGMMLMEGTEYGDFGPISTRYSFPHPKHWTNPNETFDERYARVEGVTNTLYWIVAALIFGAPVLYLILG